MGAPRHWRRGLGPPLAPVGSPRVCTEVWHVRSVVPGPLLASHCPLPSRQQSDLFETGNPLTSLLCKTNVTGFTLPFGEGHKPEPHLGALACVAPRFISCPAPCATPPPPRGTRSFFQSLERARLSCCHPGPRPFVNSHHPSRPCPRSPSLISSRSSVLPVTYHSLSLSEALVTVVTSFLFVTCGT